MRQALILMGGAAVLYGLLWGKDILTGHFSGEWVRINRYWLYGLGAVTVVLVYESVRLAVSRMLGILVRGKYDYERILKDALRGLMRIESLERMARLSVHFATMRMGIESAAALLWDANKKTFRVVCTRGYGACAGLASGQKSGEGCPTIALDDPLIRYLTARHEVLEIGHVKGLLQKEDRSGKGKADAAVDLEAVLKRLDGWRAVCVIPSFLGKELKSLLVLGGKKSGASYSARDLDVFFTLAQEAAIAIENARLYDEALAKTREIDRINREHVEASRKLQAALSETEEANKRLCDAHAQLVHEQKMATLGRLAASVGHEVNNPLTILSMNISRMILKYRKDPSLRVAEIADYFVKMESNIQRIKAVVNTLTGLLKKSEKGKFEPLSLKLVIEETLPLVQFQTYLDNLTGTEVEFDIPASLPLIHGNLERLQEVFLNLFTNAYHAFHGTEVKNRRIHILASVKGENPKFITVEFSDNGCGIEDETVKKLFNYGFTTKGEGKGSGIGLYMCRYIIELHGGEITVQSQKGEGTTFTLTLPIFEEERRLDVEDASNAAKVQ